MKFLIYRLFRRIPFTKDFTRRVESRMTILYPGSRSYIFKKTEETLIRIILFSGLVVGGMMMFADLSLYYFLVVAAMIYVVCSSMIYNRLDKLETKILEEFQQFITDVRYRFKFDGMIEEALEDGINSAGYEMSLHGQKILDTLRENRRLSYDNPYKEYAPNHFFMTFYVMCETVMIYGDKLHEGKSVFLANMGYLKEDIHNELLRRKKIQSEFMGLTGVTVLPIFAIKPIEVWSSVNMPELSTEYESTSGIITTLLLVMFSISVFMIIKRLRYPAGNEASGNEWIVRLSHVPLINKFLLYIISSNYKKYFRMDRLLKSIVYKYNVRELILMRVVYSVLTGITGMILGFTIGLGVWSVVFGIVLSMVMYLGIYVGILFEKEMMMLNREEEVVRFQTIILILMHMDMITIEKMLEYMESFAIIFRDNLERISDQLAYKGKRVFEEAKDEVSFIPFERLIDAFIASDRIGIEAAFEDVESDRKYYVDKHRQDNDELVKNKALIAKFIAFIPLCSVIILKLIIPFVVMGMSQLGNIEMMV